MKTIWILSYSNGRYPEDDEIIGAYITEGLAYAEKMRELAATWRPAIANKAHFYRIQEVELLVSLN